MDRQNLEGVNQYSDLNLSAFDLANYSVYVLDKDWNYLYVNKFVEKNLGEKGNDLIGRNMWTTFPELAGDYTFRTLKASAENNISQEIITTSPITGQRLSIKGNALSDCYVFFSTILPNKAELLNELREFMRKDR